MTTKQLGLRVLIADDDLTNRVMLQRMMDMAGCSALAVASGREAVEACRSQSFDVVLLDCRMPGMDGYETAGAIRALGDTRGLPIIAVTAAAFPEDVARAEDAGMVQLSKPFRFPDLIDLLERVTGGQPAG